ncbi:MAG: DMT family transporter [Thermodesulfobacteriota bacterium]
MGTELNKKPLIRLDSSLVGPLLMISVALLFTVLNILVKTLRPEYTVWHIGFFRFFGGMLILVSIFSFKGNPYKGNNIRLLIIRGCVGSIAFTSLITAIRLLPVSTALVIFYSYPVFSAICSFLIYKERISIAGILSIAVMIAGVAVLFDFHPGGGAFGQTLAIVGSMFAGLTVTLIRSLRQNNGPVVIYLYFCTMGSLVTFPGFITNPIFPVSIVEGLMVMGIILTSVMAQLLMNQGFFYCKGWEGGVLMSTEVIFTALVGIIFLNDPTTLQFWIGGLMVVGSGLMLNRRKPASE